MKKLKKTVGLFILSALFVGGAWWINKDIQGEDYYHQGLNDGFEIKRDLAYPEDSDYLKGYEAGLEAVMYFEVGLEDGWQGKSPAKPKNSWYKRGYVDGIRQRHNIVRKVAEIGRLLISQFDSRK